MYCTRTLYNIKNTVSSITPHFLCSERCFHVGVLTQNPQALRGQILRGDEGTAGDLQNAISGLLFPRFVLNLFVRLGGGAFKYFF